MSHQLPQQKSDLLAYEKKAYEQGFKQIAGVDEAGRGPLAGPVFAAACLIDQGLEFPGINDSKLLNEKARERFFALLTTHPGVSYGIGWVDHLTIDRINIFQATKLAMKKALDKLPKKPDYILIDAVKLSYKKIPVESVIKGDRSSQSIAAASILAKVARDEKMRALHKKYPLYGFDQHKGYGTEAHLEALEKQGPCPIHRRSFKPVANCLNLTF